MSMAYSAVLQLQLSNF